MKDDSLKPRRRSPAKSSNSPRLSQQQLNSIAGFHAHEIRRATLKEVLDPRIPTKNIPELTMHEFYDLAAARLKLLPDDFQLAVMGFGLIDKQRALDEVRARTELGKHIAISQIHVLQQLTRSAQGGERGRKT